MFDNNATFALLTASTDLGETFSSPVDISAQVKRPSWGFWAPTLKGIQLVHHPEHAGRLVVSADFVPYQPGRVGRPLWGLQVGRTGPGRPLSAGRAATCPAPRPSSPP